MLLFPFIIHRKKATFQLTQTKWNIEMHRDLFHTPEGTAKHVTHRILFSSWIEPIDEPSEASKYRF